MERETVIQILKEHERELNDLGVVHVSVFGSVARGDNNPDSDVDVAASFAPDARPSLITLVRIEQRLSDWLCAPVDFVKLPVRRTELQTHIERDAVCAF